MTSAGSAVLPSPLGAALFQVLLVLCAAASFFSTYQVLAPALVLFLVYTASALPALGRIKPYVLALGLVAVFLVLHLKGNLLMPARFVLAIVLIGCFVFWVTFLYRQRARLGEYITGLDLFLLNGAFLFSGFALIHQLVSYGAKGLADALRLGGVIFLSYLVFFVVSKTFSSFDHSRSFRRSVGILIALLLLLPSSKVLYAYVLYQKAQDALIKGELQKSFVLLESTRRWTESLALPSLEAARLELKARCYERERKYSDAVENMIRARRVKDNKERWAGLVEICVKAGQLEQASAFLDEPPSAPPAEDLALLSPYARIRLAFHLFNDERLPLARTIFQTLDKRADSHAALDSRALYYLGLLCSEWKYPQEALNAFLAAADKDPNFADVHYQIGKLYETQRNRPLSLRHYLKSLEIIPSHLASLSGVEHILSNLPEDLP